MKDIDGVEEVAIPTVLPRLVVHQSDLPSMVHELRDLSAANETLFDRGRVLVEIKRDANGELFSRDMQISNIVMKAHECCQPVLIGRNGNERAITLPDKVARMYLESAEWRVKPLAGISTAPLLRADGVIVSQPGYDAHSEIYCDAPPTVALPDRPSVDQARAALAQLRVVFKTFPFADAQMINRDGVAIVDQTHPPGYSESAYLCSVLTAVARCSLWLAPGTLIVAPNMSGSGAGKGLLARAIAIIAYGIRASAFPAGKEDEFEKRLGAKLLTGTPFVFADNINDRMMRSETLASAITERPAEVRILGYSKMLLLNSAAFFTLTGNGLRVTEDLARRFLIVTIDPKMEDPEGRPFKPGFLNDVMRSRVGLLEAALTILRYGRQQAIHLKRGKPVGSFEQWAQWVRDPLLSLGCADPVEEMLRNKLNNPRRREVRELFGKWAEHHRSDLVAVSQLHQDVLNLIDPHNKGRQFVARAVERYVDTRVGGYVLTRSKGGRWSTTTYKLLADNGSALADDQPATDPMTDPMTPPMTRVGRVIGES